MPKWLVIPWDLDRTFGDLWRGSFDQANLPLLLGTKPRPGPTGWNRLEDRFLSEPILRTRFLNRLDELLQKIFTEEKLFPILDQFESQIESDAARDREQWPGAPADIHAGVAEIKGYIAHRRAFLLRETARLRRED